MRTRLVILSAGLSCLLVTAAPAIATAAPHHNRGLTINAVPKPIIAGEGVLIYGQLNGAASAGQTIYLYHRIDPAPSYSLIGKTTTSAAGFYEFTRVEGRVLSNRSWFVRGPSGSHSRTVHERVAALLSLATAKTSATTGQPVVFTGSIAPAHPLQRVLLQEQSSSSGSAWKTIAAAFTDGGSNFSVPHRWARPGTYTLRVLLNGSARNITAESDSVTVTIQQAQKPAFTISASAPVIAEGEPVNISGALDEAATTTPEPSTQVTLYGSAGGEPPVALATTTTGADGSYSFTETPIHSEVYQARDTLEPARVTASLSEGVQDQLTLEASSTTATVGATATISGTVTPDKTGHPISLQRLGADGNWHDVEHGVVDVASRYSFTYTFGQAGAFELRARVYGGPDNVGAVSAPVTITVSGVAPATSLPFAS
jgi:hypothetical protein